MGGNLGKIIAGVSGYFLIFISSALTKLEKVLAVVLQLYIHQAPRDQNTLRS
jgi:hypothetical protein